MYSGLEPLHALVHLAPGEFTDEEIIPPILVPHGLHRWIGSYLVEDGIESRQHIHCVPFQTGRHERIVQHLVINGRLLRQNVDIVITA